jgi:hypothetical protein
MKLLNKFDEWILGREPWDKSSHYASDSYNCKRSQVYRWLGTKESNPNTAGSLIKMEMGNKIEDIYTDYLNWAVRTGTNIDGYIVEEFVEQWHQRYEIEGLKYPIGIRLDYVLTCKNIETGNVEKIAIELKSSFGRGIVDIQNKQKPKLDYLKQIFIYTYLTPFKVFNHPYLGRDSGYRTEFEIIGDEKGLTVYGSSSKKRYNFNWNQLIEKLKVVEQFVEKKEIPGRDFQVAIKNGEIKNKFQHKKIEYKSDWQCLYCNWMDLCWKDEVCKYQNSNNSEVFNERNNV